MIELHNIAKNYGKRQILKNISLQLDTGIYGFLGPNGAGKTTLFRILAGTLAPTKTENLLLPARKDIGYLPQQFGCFPDFTLEEQLLYFAALKGLAGVQARAELDRVLAAVHLEEQRSLRCRKLSGGMVRRAGIAQALLGSPSLLLLDEPTTGLDPEERKRFRDIIEPLGQSMAILLSTHIVTDVAAICTSVIVLNRGRIVFQGDLAHLAALSGTEPADIETGYLALVSEHSNPATTR